MPGAHSLPLPARADRRAFGVRAVAPLLAIAFLAGCATVGTREAMVMDEEEAFERGLMAYVRGELDAAAAHLEEALRLEAHDRRAFDLLQAIRAEQGLLTQAAPSPPAVPLPATPEEILRLVKTQNPQIRKTVFQVIEARARLREANVSISPELVLLARLYPLGFFTSLTQSLYGGLIERRASMNEAEQMIVDAVADYAHTRNEALSRALAACIDLRRAEAARAHIAEWERIQSERLRVARVQADFAKVLPDEPLEQYADLRGFRGQALAAEQELALARVTLNGLLDRYFAAPLALAPLEFRAEVPSDVHQMVALAGESRYDFKQTAARVAQARAHRDVVDSSTPDLDLRASYGLRARDSTDTFQRGGSVAAILRLPVLIRPLKHAQLDRETAIVRQLEMDRATLAGRMAEQVVKAHGDYQLARDGEEVALGRATAALERLRIAQVRDRWVGDVDALRLDGERLRWEQAVEEVTAGRYAVQHALVDLYRAMGRDIEELAASTAAAMSRAELIRRIAGRGRALWVWRPEFLATPAETAFFLDFAEARRIDVVYLYTSGAVLREPERLREFLRAAHGRGIAVHALHGEADWFEKDERRRALAFVRAVVQFNAGGKGEERYDAIHLDVEPHTLEAWQIAAPAERERLLDRYTGFVRRVARELGDALPLVVDVPARYSGLPKGTERVLDEILAHVDGVVLMTYRSDAARVVAAAQPLLSPVRGKAADVRLWVGVSADPAHLCGPISDGEFETMLRAVDEQLSASGVAEGVAIHDYDRYRATLISTAPPRRDGRKCAETDGAARAAPSRTAESSSGLRRVSHAL